MNLSENNSVEITDEPISVPFSPSNIITFTEILQVRNNDAVSAIMFSKLLF